MRTGFVILPLFILVLASCEPENSPPVVKVHATPGVGDTATVFMLEGKNSTDRETSYFALRYRWDTDADGTWDSEYSTRSSYTARFNHPGYRKYILEVADDDGGTATATDSVYILGMNSNLDSIVDPRDGKSYRTVLIGSDWWMAENLRFGIPVPYDLAPMNNERAEYLRFNTSVDAYGSLYTWDEANYYPGNYQYRDICPPGWRLPTPAQWSNLLHSYPKPFDVLHYFGPSSIENLGLGMTGYYRYGDPRNPMKGEFRDELTGVRYWTSEFTGADTTRYFTAIHFSRDSWNFAQSYNRTEWIRHPIFLYIIGYRTPEACYVRCIRKNASIH
jgi:uncharacterized protein (TIGR02145 family)